MARQGQVTLDDVAASAGVSRATASRALTGSGPASAAVQARVRAAAEHLGFTPNQAARALASNKAHAVALVIPEPNTIILGDPFLQGMIIGVSEAFHPTDYQVILLMVRPDDPPGKVLRLLHRSFVDGAIVVSHHRTGVERLSGVGVPLVFVGRPWWMHAEVMYVDVANRAGGALAARRFLDRGASRFACIAGPEDMTPVRDRTAGWRETLVGAGYDPGPVEHAPFTHAGGAESAARLVGYGADAVFVQSDLMAVGALRAFTEAGVRVGTDMLMIGVDDSEFARSTSPRLTSVTNPAADLSLRAARMLLGVLDFGRCPVTPEIIQPELVVRESA
ncbi:MAG: LacI family transcriptional regulator [Propionibacteriaceae bacterium]|jgi:DNA-binding LacI/PurR family transcriptional regulator|nr:LacI family transcriptional regulator [Propionibacteriaceae bacterium]